LFSGDFDKESIRRATAMDSVEGASSREKKELKMA
jgi:hypothetical protein